MGMNAYAVVRGRFVICQDDLLLRFIFRAFLFAFFCADKEGRHARVIYKKRITGIIYVRFCDRFMNGAN